MDEQPRPRDAGLSGSAEDGGCGTLSCTVEIGIGEHDVRRLAAELQGHRDEVPAGIGSDQGTRLGSAGEADVVDAGKARHSRAGLRGAGHDVDDTARETGLERQTCHLQGGSGCVLGWFDDHAVARRESRRELVGQQREW